MANLIKLPRSLTCLLIVFLVASNEVLCGGKGKGSDIILYKNNLLIRSNKGKGGNLLIADPHHHHHGHHGHHGHHDHQGHQGHQEHSHHKQVVMMSGGKGKGKGKGGGMSWENLVMGGGKY